MEKCWFLEIKICLISGLVADEKVEQAKFFFFWETNKQRFFIFFWEGNKQRWEKKMKTIIIIMQSCFQTKQK